MARSTSSTEAGTVNFGWPPTPCFRNSSRQNHFDASICAAACPGPTVGIFTARSASATPAASGASGPMTAASTRWESANSATRGASVGSSRADALASRSSPGFVLELTTKTSASDRRSVAAMACVRASPPTTRNRMAATGGGSGYMGVARTEVLPSERLPPRPTLAPRLRTERWWAGSRGTDGDPSRREGTRRHPRRVPEGRGNPAHPACRVAPEGREGPGGSLLPRPPVPGPPDPLHPHQRREAAAGPETRTEGPRGPVRGPAHRLRKEGRQGQGVEAAEAMLKECAQHGYFRAEVCPVCGQPCRFLMNDRELDHLGRVLTG